MQDPGTRNIDNMYELPERAGKEHSTKFIAHFNLNKYKQQLSKLQK